ETDPSVGDVGGGRDHRYAHGLDRHDRARHDAEDHVEVMDHEIEDDVDVGTTLDERGEAVTLEKARSGEDRRERADRGVEAAEVADADDGGPQRHASCSRSVASLTPMTAMPARSASASIDSRSIRIVLSLSSASTLAFAAIIDAIVRGPTAGTSKRRS